MKKIRNLIILVLIIGGIYYLSDNYKHPIKEKLTKNVKLTKTEVNYGKDVDRIAREFNLPAHYLKALITLECSGRKEFEPRYEKHVHNKLKNLKNKKLTKYENLTPETIHDASDEALKNMASSWGPFQLMGYKCVLLNINVADIRGENAVYWGIKWIDLTYGDYLRKGKFKDAFHMHNTGKRYPKVGLPKTHDPNYVSNGITYMEYFKTNIR